MAAETIVIDIVANFKNQVGPGMSAAKQYTDRFTDSVQKAKKETDRLGKSHAKPKVSLVDRASSSLSKIDNSLKSIGKKSVNAIVRIKDFATSPLRAIKNSLFSIKGLVMAIGAGWAANKLFSQPLSLADSYSSAKIGFSNLMGEAGGQKMMNDLDAFAKKTPFKTSGVISNAQKMLAMGWNPEDIIKDMEIIGNAAASTGKMDQGLESIVRALAQIKTKGKLSTEELNQLSEAGIAAKAMLAEQLGYGTGDKGIAKMTKDLEKGLIGSETAVEALLQGMKKFDGTMEKTANETVEGLKSQLEDTFEINVARRWGQGLQDGAKRGLGSILKLLDESEEGLEKFGDTVYEIGKDLSNWAADKLENTIDKILEVTDSQAFKDASLGGKIKILWDEVIAEPLSKWWNSKGKPFMAEKATEFGESLGSGISKGMLALLGVDVTDTIGDAATIGGSFATGFAKGFEGAKVWDALISAAGRAFTAGFKSLFNSGAVGKVIAAGIALKITSGVLSGISTAKTLWLGSGAEAAAGLSGVGYAGGGLKGFLGGASTASGTLVGSGLIGGLAKAGSFLGSGAYTGAGLAAAGLGGVAGGLTTAYGIFDMFRDFNTAYDTDGSTKLGRAKKSAYTSSGGFKAGGLAGGAAAGAAIGSVIPGLGTAIGALIGGGLGWLGGKFFGDKEVKKYEELARSTEAAKYNSKEMKDAIMEGSASAEELDMIFQRACSEDMVNRFGKIELSMEEISKYAKSVVFGEDTKIMEKFANASQKAAQSMETFHTAAEDMERLNFDMSERQWKIKAGIDTKLSKEEIADVKARVQSFMDSAEKALSDSHYEFNVAVDVLLSDGETKDGIIASGNKLYQKLQKDLDSANKKLEAQYEIALKDGVITADEQKILSDYQQKVTDIINKISDAETEASFEIAKLKFTTGDLSADSFTNLQSSLNTQLETYIGQQDVALQASVSDLQLQMSEDPENADKYKQQIQDLVNGYNTNVENMVARVEKVQLEGISEAFDGAGTVEQLQSAISALTEEGKNPVDLTFSDINAHLDIKEDSLSEEEKANFTSVMKQALQSSMTGENAIEAKADVATKLTADEETLALEAAGVKSTAHKTLQDQFLDPLSVEGTAALKLKWSITSGKTATVDINGSSKTLTASLTQKANGGYVDKPIQALIGEAGPEMIIPLSSNRRQRGKALWERAGRAMGLYQSSDVIPNADGGLYGYGSSRLGDMLSGAFSGRKTETGQRTAGNGVNVNVGGIQISIQSGGNGLKDDLKKNADAIAGQIADMLQQAFQNMPIAVEE